MKKIIKKYWALILIYIIMLIVFPAPVMGFSVLFIAFYISYKIGRWLGFGSCSSDDDDDDDLTNMMLFHHYTHKNN